MISVGKRIKIINKVVAQGESSHARTRECQNEGGRESEREKKKKERKRERERDSDRASEYESMRERE